MRAEQTQANLGELERTATEKAIAALHTLKLREAEFVGFVGPTPYLDDKHTIFGQCNDKAVALAEDIAATGGAGDRPTEPQVVEHVVIESR